MTGLVNPARSRFTRGSIAAAAAIAAGAVTKVEIVALGGAEQQTKHQPEGNRRDISKTRLFPSLDLSRRGAAIDVRPLLAPASQSLKRIWSVQKRAQAGCFPSAPSSERERFWPHYLRA